MLLSESAIKRCLEIIVAAQTPWGEWGSIANELKRTQRVKRYTNLNNFNIPIIPKPNGFRTLLAVEILGNWISDGYQEVLDSVHRWFETSFDHGWIQIHKIIQSGIVGSIGNQGPAYVIESVSDIRHTAQAIEFFCRYSSLNAEHYDTIRNIIKNQNNGSWSLFLLSEDNKDLKSLIDGIKHEDWRELHENISRYLLSIESPKPPFPPRIKGIISLGREILYELASRTASHMLKSS